MIDLSKNLTIAEFWEYAGYGPYNNSDRNNLITAADVLALPASDGLIRGKSGSDKITAGDIVGLDQEIMAKKAKGYSPGKKYFLPYIETSGFNSQGSTRTINLSKSVTEVPRSVYLAVQFDKPIPSEFKVRFHIQCLPRDASHAVWSEEESVRDSARLAAYFIPISDYYTVVGRDIYGVPKNYVFRLDFPYYASMLDIKGLVMEFTDFDGTNYDPGRIEIEVKTLMANFSKVTTGFQEGTKASRTKLISRYQDRGLLIPERTGYLYIGTMSVGNPLMETFIGGNGPKIDEYFKLSNLNYLTYDPGASHQSIIDSIINSESTQILTINVMDNKVDMGVRGEETGVYLKYDGSFLTLSDYVNRYLDRSQDDVNSMSDYYSPYVKSGDEYLGKFNLVPNSTDPSKVRTLVSSSGVDTLINKQVYMQINNEGELLVQFPDRLKNISGYSQDMTTVETTILPNYQPLAEHDTSAIASFMIDAKPQHRYLTEKSTGRIIATVPIAVNFNNSWSTADSLHVELHTSHGNLTSTIHYTSSTRSTTTMLVGSIESQYRDRIEIYGIETKRLSGSSILPHVSSFKLVNRSTRVTIHDLNNNSGMNMSGLGYVIDPNGGNITHGSYTMVDLTIGVG